MATGPIPHNNSIGYGEIPANPSRRGFLKVAFWGAVATGAGIKITEVISNTSELGENQKLIIPNIKSLKLASGEPVSSKNNPATILGNIGILPNRQGAYTFTSEDLSKTGIVVKFPDVTAPKIHADNNYLLIRIKGIDFVADESKFSVVNK